MGAAQHGATQAVIPTDKVLYAAFFLLGMGLMAPWSGVLQTMDYLEAVFEDFDPSRILTICYSLVDLVVLFVLFFFPQVWPNRKSRIAAGYIMFTIVMVILPIFAAFPLGADRARRAAYCVWAVASAVIGVSDALISSVAYAESAAIGPTYTHAFIGGKALSGVILAVLRCISKGAMPEDLDGLKRSTSIYLAFAAAIVFCCVLVVLVLLPRKQKQIDALKKRPGLTVAQTLQVMQSIKHEQLMIRQATLRSRRGSRIGSMNLPAPPRSGGSGLFLSMTLASQSYIEKTRNIGRAGADMFANLGQPTYSLFEVIDAAIARNQSPSDVESAPLPRVHEGSEADMSSSSSSSSDSGEAPANGAGIAGKDVVCQPGDKKTATAWRQTAGMALQLHRYKQQQAAAAAAAAGSKDVAADVEANLDGLAVAPQEKSAPLNQPPAAAAAAVSPVVSTGSADAAAAKPKPQLPRSRESLRRFADGGLVREGLSVAQSSWLAMKLVYPYMVAATLVFLIANTIFPMCLSPERGEWPEAGSWYYLILVLAYEGGTLLGSTIPIWTPRHPRTTVMCGALAMFAFVPAYVLALLFKGGPAAFITLTFVMMAYSGYIAAMVFVLVPHGLQTSDAELVEVLLVLVLTVGYILGLFLSWLWEIPGLSG